MKADGSQYARCTRVMAQPRHGRRPRAIVEMTTHTAQRITAVRGQRVAKRRHQRHATRSIAGMKGGCAFGARQRECSDNRGGEQRADQAGIEVRFLAPADMTKLLDREIADWTQAIKTANIKLD